MGRDKTLATIKGSHTPQVDLYHMNILAHVQSLYELLVYFDDMYKFINKIDSEKY